MEPRVEIYHQSSANANSDREVRRPLENLADVAGSDYHFAVSNEGYAKGKKPLGDLPIRILVGGPLTEYTSIHLSDVLGLAATILRGDLDRGSILIDSPVRSSIENLVEGLFATA